MMEGSDMNEMSVLDSGLIPVADEVFAEAYDAVDASLRARLKTNIALHHSMFGVSPSLQVTHTERATAGFAMAERRRPVSWAVIVLAEDFASGPRLIAALMPALLAGVGDIQVVRMVGEGEESPWPQALLAALELAGQEQAASATVDVIVDFVKRKSSCGRVLFLGDDAVKSHIAHTVAKMAHVGLWSEGDAPRLCVESEQGVDTDLIRWAHPDGVFCDADAKDIDAIYMVEDGTKAETQAPLALQKGCEALWMYPRLRPEFFMQDSVTIALFE